MIGEGDGKGCLEVATAGGTGEGVVMEMLAVAVSDEKALYRTDGNERLDAILAV